MKKPINIVEKLDGRVIMFGTMTHHIETTNGDVLWIFPLNDGVLTPPSHIRIHWEDTKRSYGVPYKMVWGDGVDNKGILFKEDIHTLPNFIQWLRSKIRMMYN